MTPARSYSPLVNNRRQKLFHRLAHKIHCCTPRGIKDLQLTMSFLTTRVGKCIEKDCEKLRRLVNYNGITKNKESTVCAEDIGSMHAHIIVSCAVHLNMKSHSGGAISFSIGLIASTLQKQKLNARSSAEAEIVGVSDTLRKALFIDLFLVAQGYPLKENILY